MTLLNSELIKKVVVPIFIILLVMGGINFTYIDEKNHVEKGEANFDLSYSFYLENQGPLNLTFLSIRLALLKTWDPVQTVQNTIVHYQPNRTTSDEYENEFLWYDFDDFRVGQSLNITIEVNLVVHLLDYSGYNFGSNVYDENNPQYQLFTAFDPLADTTDLRIQEKASELSLRSDNPIDLAFEIYNFSSSYLNYKLLSRSRGAGFALSNGYGDCDEYQNLFIALSRANGIPAIGHTAWFTDFATGLVTSDDGAAAHAYPMFYVEGVGLLPVDPTLGKDSIYDNWLKTDHRRITMTRGPDHPYRLLNYRWVPQDGIGDPSVLSNYTINVHNLDIIYTSNVRLLILATIIAVPIIFLSRNVFFSRRDRRLKKAKLERILSPTVKARQEDFLN